MHMDAVEWAMKAEKLGAGEILLTSMDCDGTKAGYDIELTNTIASNVSIPVIASGGAGSKEHFLDAFTREKQMQHLLLRYSIIRNLILWSLRNTLQIMVFLCVCRRIWICR